jgi:hypothetical protein
MKSFSNLILYIEQTLSSLSSKSGDMRTPSLGIDSDSWHGKPCITGLTPEMTLIIDAQSHSLFSVSS